ncbi:ribonuclease HII [Liquorilactobacillus cacaonum]|uniref:Ribonuclease HII n=1 Tax=Liquorilactobacillus cacaonum DSM 21116 TaxID=1423729 RepID=A0A0R2CH32_9LACO|nr:ribonuclease HII [Liquorilactobacillus cacaonum]KRM90977.1 ribonuclease HII [Liquorilactobacillus cacaonum DSM 21116]
MDKKTSIIEIKKLLTTKQSKIKLEELSLDSRIGVQKLLHQYYKKENKRNNELKAFRKRFEYEQQFWQENKKLVCGIDEVGRGPLAGPVVAAAVILPHDFSLIAVNDSKKLSKTTRESLYSQIINCSISVSIGVCSNQEIDNLNIYQAARLAMLRAVNGLSVVPQQLIIDAMEIESSIPQLKLIKADAKSISVAAASIVAKVWRDHFMNFYDSLYPQYDFKSNDGYGTKNHLEAIDLYGITPLHRRSFEPIKSKF